ncbi:hypothetical protein [Bacteroides caecimuris]|uniref:hypothetical protein n=1 Tax=Bacteroides caecimuris TaxID=1796613 RepID=UPI00242FB0BC|nr:hypothetical protein [Bacteroides caecimuris]
MLLTAMRYVSDRYTAWDYGFMPGNGKFQMPKSGERSARTGITKYQNQENKIAGTERTKCRNSLTNRVNSEMFLRLSGDICL